MAPPGPQQLTPAERGCCPRGGADRGDEIGQGIGQKIGQEIGTGVDTGAGTGVDNETAAGRGRWLVWLPLLLIQGYRFGISPFIAPHCRHFPSCSQYAVEALRRHGLGRGLWLAGRRLARCGPNGGDWSYDPVPPAAQAQARPSRPLPKGSC